LISRGKVLGERVVNKILAVATGKQPHNSRDNIKKLAVLLRGMDPRLGVGQMAVILVNQVKKGSMLK
jgi:hypothetical protein